MSGRSASGRPEREWRLRRLGIMFVALLNAKELPPTFWQMESANLAKDFWAAIGSATMLMSGQMVE